MKSRDNVTSEYKKMNTKDLSVDEFYQREIDPKRIMRMVKNYDPCLVNAIKLSYRDGKYYIFDGRHTSVLEKTVRGKGKDVMVDCKVFYGLSRADETELFIEQNGDASPVNKAAKLRALYNAGDPDVVGMVNDTARAGVTIDPKFNKNPAASKIIAYEAIQRIYIKFKDKKKIDEYVDMLNVINTAWDGNKDAFVRDILNGMAKFYEVYGGEFRSTDLVKALRRFSPMQIIREGKSEITGSSTAAGYARAIVRAYNKGRSSRRLEEKL